MGNTLISNPYNPAAPAITTDEADARMQAASGGPIVVHTPLAQQESDMLTCTMGIWTDPPPDTYTYQWIKDGVDLEGAFEATYLILPEDIGTSFSCRVVASHALGDNAVISNIVVVADPLAARSVGRTAGKSALPPDQPTAHGRTQRDDVIAASDDEHEEVEVEEDVIDDYTRKPTGQKKKVVKKVPKRR